jgi:hypothetical protein
LVAEGVGLAERHVSDCGGLVSLHPQLKKALKGRTDPNPLT